MQWGMTRCANGLLRTGSTQFNDVYLLKSGSESQTVSRFFIPSCWPWIICLTVFKLKLGQAAQCSCSVMGAAHLQGEQFRTLLPGFIFFFSRLSESSFKVHVEKLSLEQRKMDRSKQLYLIPLEIKLKHSTVHMDEHCPLLEPNPGVSAIHDYADWVRKASEDPAVTEGEYGIILFTIMIENLENCPIQVNFRLHQSSEMWIKQKNWLYLSILSESISMVVGIGELADFLRWLVTVGYPSRYPTRLCL